MVSPWSCGAVITAWATAFCAFSVDSETGLVVGEAVVSEVWRYFDGLKSDVMGKGGFFERQGKVGGSLEQVSDQMGV